MSMEVQCPGCGQRLQVDRQYAGQSASCPVCHAQFTVPATSVSSETSAFDEPPEPAVWSVKTPEGRIYRQVTKSELDRWVSEGRVDTDCQVSNQTNERWVGAEEVYPVLNPGVGIARTRGNPFAPAQFYAVSPVAAPAATPVTAVEPNARYLAPHRGGLILALGIMAFVVACPVLSFLAWIMGTNDLREMRAGRMDPAGMNATQAGMTLGMLLSVAAMIGLLGLVFYVIFETAL